MNYNAKGGRRETFEYMNNKLNDPSRKKPIRNPKKSPDLNEMISVKVNDKTTLFFKHGTSQREIDQRIKRFNKANGKVY